MPKSREMHPARFLRLIPIFSLLLAACDDYYYRADNNRPPINNGYAIESEPTLSPDRQYFYYVSIDTALESNSGIYRAMVSRPLREKVLTGNDYHSPTISPNNRTLAYLDSGQVYFFDMMNKTVRKGDVADSFASIVFVNDTLLAACVDQWLYLVGSNQDTSIFYSYGWDPSYLARDTFVYIKGSDSSYSVIKNDIDNSGEIVLYRLYKRAVPHWPTYDPAMRRLSFTLEWYFQKFVYTTQVGDSLYFIDSTLYPHPCLLDYNLVIYTGRDSRFWRSDFYSESQSPFWYVKD